MAEGARRAARAEAAFLGLAVFAGDDDGQRAVDVESAEQVDVTIRVGADGRTEFDRAGREWPIVRRSDQALIEHGDISRRREGAAAGTSSASLRGEIEVQDRLREDLAAGDRQWLLGVDDRGGAVVLFVGQADEQTVAAHRIEQVGA